MIYLESFKSMWHSNFELTFTIKMILSVLESSVKQKLKYLSQFDVYLVQ